MKKLTSKQIDQPQFCSEKWKIQFFHFLCDKQYFFFMNLSSNSFKIHNIDVAQKFCKIEKKICFYFVRI